MSSIAPYAKAVVAALVAGLTALGTALADGNVEPVEWTGVIVAFLVLGFYPKVATDIINPSVQHTLSTVGVSDPAPAVSSNGSEQ